MQKVFEIFRSFLHFLKVKKMELFSLIDCFERSPIISAVQDDLFNDALKSPSEVIFYLKANILTVAHRIESAHRLGKLVFVHIDLAEGIGKDRSGIEFLASCGVDGIISTKAPLILRAKECGLLTVQRFFAVDSQGVSSIKGMLMSSKPDMIEIMPGIVCKIIKRLSPLGKPIIAGGLIETKREATEILSSGAVAISTGNRELWGI